MSYYCPIHNYIYLTYHIEGYYTCRMGCEFNIWNRNGRVEKSLKSKLWSNSK